MVKIYSNIARAVGVAPVLWQLASLGSHQVESWPAHGQVGDGRRHRSLVGEFGVRCVHDVPKRAWWSQSRINPKLCTATPQRRTTMDLFDEDDDDDESNAASSIHQEERERRPKENGALQFHEGTEDALLIYVRNRVQQQQQDPCRPPVQPAAESVLQSIDAFCLDRHWMMHCGPQKGVVLEEFLLERYRAHQRQQQQPPQPFVVVELGSYCGYSAIRMARALSSLSTETNDFHIYSIDVQPKLLRIATDMTRLAGLDHCISFHLLRKGTSLHHLLQEILGADEKGGNRSEHTGINDDDTTMKMIHFCMLDHAKDLYLSDLLQLERHGHLRQGSAVAADNVIFARIDDYRRHVQSAAYLSTRLVAGPLEYQEEIPDGIELSVYNMDPTTNAGPPGPGRG